MAVSIGAAHAFPPPSECDGLPAQLRNVEVALRRLGSSSASARFVATLPVSPAATFEPAATGMRFGFGSLNPVADLIQLTVPGGAGWTMRGPEHWVYKALVSSGVKRMSIKRIESSPVYETDRAYAITVDAVGLTLPPLSETEAYQAHVGLLDGSRQCGALTFFRLDLGRPAGWKAPAWERRCRSGALGRTMRCETGRPLGTCRVSSPEDMVRCDALQVDAAQATYLAEHGTYFGGACADLPGVSLSPVVGCYMAVEGSEFVATLHHLEWFFRCEIGVSPPGVGIPLDCEHY